MNKHQGPAQGVFDGPGLSFQPAAPDVDQDVELRADIHQEQGLAHQVPGGLHGEVVFELPLIHDNPAIAGTHINPGYRGLALTRGMDACFLRH